MHLYTSPLRALQVADEVRAELSAPGRDEPITVPLRPAGPNHYISDGLVIPFPGAWRLEVTARFDRFERVDATFELPVG